MYMNGTDLGGEINGSSAREPRMPVVVAVVVVTWLMRLSTREDLLRLWREVRLFSRGFMSGGSLDILRNNTPR